MLRVFAVTQAEDIGALVDENLFERDILLATKKLASSSNISERTQGENPSLFSSSYICKCEVSRLLFVCLLFIAVSLRLPYFYFLDQVEQSF